MRAVRPLAGRRLELWVEARDGVPAVNPVVRALLNDLTAAGAAVRVRVPDAEIVDADALGRGRPPDLVMLKTATTLGLSLAVAVEAAGVPFLNPAATTLRAHDKAATIARLAAAGLPVPETFLGAGAPADGGPAEGVSPGDGIGTGVSAAWVSKPTRGVHGRGVTFHRTFPDALSPDLAPSRWRGSESALGPPWDTNRRHDPDLAQPRGVAANASDPPWDTNRGLRSLDAPAATSAAGAAGVPTAAGAEGYVVDDGTRLVQRRIGAGEPDLKAYVADGEVFAGAKPFGPESYTSDAIAPRALTPAERTLVCECGAVLGLRLFGVDLRMAEDGLAIIDVNPFPGYRGFPDAVPALRREIERALREAGQ